MTPGYLVSQDCQPADNFEFKLDELHDIRPSLHQARKGWGQRRLCHGAHLDAPTQPPMGHGNCRQTSYANFNAGKFLWAFHKSYLYVRYGRSGWYKMR